MLRQSLKALTIFGRSTRFFAPPRQRLYSTTNKSGFSLADLQDRIEQHKSQTKKVNENNETTVEDDSDVEERKKETVLVVDNDALCQRNAEVNVRNVILQYQDSPVQHTFSDNIVNLDPESTEPSCLSIQSVDFFVKYIPDNRMMILNTPLTTELPFTSESQAELMKNILIQSRLGYCTPFGGISCAEESYFSLSCHLSMATLDEFQLLYRLPAFIEFSKYWRAAFDNYITSGKFHSFPIASSPNWYHGPNPTSSDKFQALQNAIESYTIFMATLNTSIGSAPALNPFITPIVSLSLTPYEPDQPEIPPIQYFYNEKNMCFHLFAPIYTPHETQLEHVSFYKAFWSVPKLTQYGGVYYCTNAKQIYLYQVINIFGSPLNYLAETMYQFFANYRLLRETLPRRDVK